MIINYPCEDNDIERQKKEIVNIINKNMSLKIKFIDYLKVYGFIFIILFLTTLPLLKNIVLFYIITSVIVLIYFITISVLYFFQSYEIKYDANKEMLVIKKSYNTLFIPKCSLKKIYVKTHRRAGTNLYIDYINNKNKEKCILLDIFLLQSSNLKDFLDIFII